MTGVVMSTSKNASGVPELVTLEVLARSPAGRAGTARPRRSILRLPARTSRRASNWSTGRRRR